MKYLLLVVLLLPNFAQAEWTSVNTKKEATYIALHVIDWGQTRYIVEHPEKYKEASPVIGNNPTLGKVDSYFIKSGIIHIGIGYILPQGYWRDLYQNISIGVKAGVVGYNYSLGVKVSF